MPGLCCREQVGMGTSSSSLHIAGAPVVALQGQRVGRKGMGRKKGALAGLWMHCTDGEFCRCC